MKINLTKYLMLEQLTNPQQALTGRKSGCLNIYRFKNSKNVQASVSMDNKHTHEDLQHCWGAGWGGHTCEPGLRRVISAWITCRDLVSKINKQTKRESPNLSKLSNACFNFCILGLSEWIQLHIKAQRAINFPKRLFKLNFSKMLTGMADIRKYPVKLISKSHNLQFHQVFETEQRFCSLKTEQ